MEYTQIIVAFLVMIGLVITLGAAEKWMKDLRAAKAEATRRHDHGV